MAWTLSKVWVLNSARFICVVASCVALASCSTVTSPGAHTPVGEKSPEAVIQLFYKAAREGKYAEAQQYLSRESQEYIKNIKTYAPIAESWVAVADKHTRDRTLQTVEVSEVTTFAAPHVGEEVVTCSVLTRFADGSAQQSRIVLVRERAGAEWRIFWIGKLKVEQASHDYLVRIYSKEYPSAVSDWTGYFEILRRGHRVYMSEFGRFSLSHRRVYDKKWNYTEKIVAPMGKDITGDGKPNLVVYEYTGGAHCCRVYHIFEIGSEFGKIAELDGRDGYVEFTDLDRDSKLEVVIKDWTFAYFLTYFAAYRPPAVILRYQDGAYRIAVDLMHKPAPSREVLARRARQAREDSSWEVKHLRQYGWVPKSLWATLLELLYTGHPDLAWKFLEMAWPPNIPWKDAWLNKFRANLEESPYWPLDSKRAHFLP